MTILVNDVKLDFSLEKEQSLGDVLVSLEEWLSEGGAAVIGVAADGEPLEGDALKAAAGRPLAGVGTLAVRAITAEELRGVLQAQEGALRSLAAKLENLPVLLQGGSRAGAADILRLTADTLGEFCETARFCDLFGGTFTVLVPLLAELPALFGDFCTAIEEGDLVLTGDLGEYEIRPRVLALADALGALG
jgi:hypothetical protein